MGSYAPSPPPSTSTSPRKTIHVLVTGFGPFHTIRLNPSYLIALALPQTLTTEKYDIHIHAHPQPIRVSYHYVREVVPLLLFPPPSLTPSGEKEYIPRVAPDERNERQRAFEQAALGKASVPTACAPTARAPTSNPQEYGVGERGKALYDIVLFIGVAPNRKGYSLETRARRDGYVTVDVDGLYVGKYAFPKEEDVPEVLKTGVDAKEVLGRWREGCADLIPPLNPLPILSLSNDAGHYLCEFIYYTGLWEYYKREPAASAYQDAAASQYLAASVYQRDTSVERPVLFLHVPKGDEAGDIETGARVAGSLIAAVAGWMGEGAGKGG
ncbi:hypothetical protein MMC30_006481 [Trapelia coarctata]|nr:hypothetical protein [Trapelia coarctata]